MNYEQEEEFLTNDLSRKLAQVNNLDSVHKWPSFVCVYTLRPWLAMQFTMYCVFFATPSPSPLSPSLPLSSLSLSLPLPSLPPSLPPSLSPSLLPPSLSS